MPTAREVLLPLRRRITIISVPVIPKRQLRITSINKRQVALLTDSRTATQSYTSHLQMSISIITHLVKQVVAALHLLFLTMPIVWPIHRTNSNKLTIPLNSSQFSQQIRQAMQMALKLARLVQAPTQAIQSVRAPVVYLPRSCSITPLPHNRALLNRQL